VPFVTSSCTLAAAAYTGGDLPHIYHRHTIGVVKAIMSRVGNGPFLSEYGGIESEQYCAKTINARAAESTLDTQQLLQSADPLDIAKGLRVRGNEYGATTGRPRRMGALDLVQLRQVIKLNAINGLFLTKADCLQDFSLTQKGTVPIVTAYHLDGAEIDYIPANVDAARRVQVTITEFPAFSQDISAIRHKEELPKELLDILHFIESFTGCPILTIGVGAEREQFVDLI
jgi:adenylosuccinate synthase